MSDERIITGVTVTTGEKSDLHKEQVEFEKSDYFKERAKER
jgi:hypothetical protein